MFFSEIEKLRNEINELKLAKVEVEVEEVSVELSSDEVEGISHNPENLTAKKELNLYSQKGKNNTMNRIFNKHNFSLQINSLPLSGKDGLAAKYKTAKGLTGKKKTAAYTALGLTISGAAVADENIENQINTFGNAQAADSTQATGFTTGEKLAGAGAAAAAYKFRKPIIRGAKAVGRGALKVLGPLSVPLELGFIGSNLKSGSTVPEALADVVMAGGIFREKDKRKFIENKYGTEALNRYVAAKTPGITDVMDVPTALPALSKELQAIDAEADAYVQTLRNQRAQEFERKSNLPRPEINPFQAAGGGIAKEAGDRSGPPPESGPNSQGLQGLLNRVKKT